MRILITPSLQKKIIKKDLPFKYQVAFGSSDSSLHNLVNEDLVQNIQLNMKDGETKKFTLEDFIIHIEEKENEV